MDNKIVSTDKARQGRSGHRISLPPLYWRLRLGVLLSSTEF
jgi:hypothetical protein